MAKRHHKIFLDHEAIPRKEADKWLVIRDYSAFTEFILKYGLPYQLSFGYMKHGDELVPPSKAAKFIIGFSLHKNVNLSHLSYDFHFEDDLQEDCIYHIFNQYYQYCLPKYRI